MNNSIKKRLFIALNLPDKIKDELASLLKILKNNNPTVKWCQPEILHLTLHFLGYQEPKSENQIMAAMQNLSGKFSAMEFKLDKLGAFPNLFNPRVIFIACQQLNGDSVLNLQSQLAEKLAELGLAVDKRSWQAHLTLGRAKDYAKFQLPVNLSLPSGKFIIDSFELMESELYSAGAKYKIVKSFKL